MTGEQQLDEAYLRQIALAALSEDGKGERHRGLKAAAWEHDW